MAAIACPNCSHSNPEGTKFCQKCGTSLLPKGIICRKCGTSNMAGAEFCGNCGTKLIEARFEMTSESAQQWRAILGSYDGMSPSFVPSKDVLAAWSTLNPPLQQEHEIFIFHVPIVVNIPFTRNPKLNCPRSALRVFSVTIGTEVIKAQETFGGPKWADLLATQRRLIAYLPHKQTVKQVLYDDFESLNLENENYIIGLRDGSQVIIESSVSKPGLLGAMAIIGAPMVAKGDILSREQAKGQIAESLTAAMTQFLMEIIHEKKRRV